MNASARESSQQPHQVGSTTLGSIVIGVCCSLVTGTLAYWLSFRDVSRDGLSPVSLALDSFLAAFLGGASVSWAPRIKPQLAVFVASVILSFCVFFVGLPIQDSIYVVSTWTITIGISSYVGALSGWHTGRYLLNLAQTSIVAGICCSLVTAVLVYLLAFHYGSREGIMPLLFVLDSFLAAFVGGASVSWIRKVRPRIAALVASVILVVLFCVFFVGSPLRYPMDVIAMWTIFYYGALAGSYTGRYLLDVTGKRLTRNT